MTREILASQRMYYDERAPDYLNTSKPDRKILGALPADPSRELIRHLRPSGDILELACGTGECTVELVNHGTSLTVVDGSERMLARCRPRLGDAEVECVHADIFEWEPKRAYDFVFFGFWLSHVPYASFDEFWSLVRRCLKPAGRVAFIDEDDRGSPHDDTRMVDGESVATRTLADGRTFDIVKVFWRPDELQDRLRSIGWRVNVQRLGDTFLYGVGGVDL